MKRWLIASILFLLPSCIAFPLVRIFGGEGYSFGRKSRIGFSLILTSGIYLGEGAVIQSGNHYCPVKAGKSVFEIVET